MRGDLNDLYLFNLCWHSQKRPKARVMVGSMFVYCSVMVRPAKKGTPPGESYIFVYIYIFLR